MNAKLNKLDNQTNKKEPNTLDILILRENSFTYMYFIYEFMSFVT